MLARHVETLMDTEGAYYPFRGVRDFFGEAVAVVGNFEGAIPPRHVQTPNGAMRFSVDAEIAPVLARTGFTHLSLANNHADDYGETGYHNTRAVLARAGMVAAGHPYELTTDDILYQELDGRVGADAVIGHHPHVVQDVEVYRNAPVFYSLGNFIFDQYWRSEVEEGLMVALSFTDAHVRYELLPVTSTETPSAPRPMKRVERTQFLNGLANRSEESLRDELRAGVIERPVF